MGLNERSDELDKKIANTNLPDAVSALLTDSKKRKRQVRILAISLILDVLLTFGLGLISIQTHNTASQSESNRQAILSTCESSNEARANNKMLWHYLLNLPTTQALTVQQKATRAQFALFIDKTFAPRNCDKVISTN